MLHRECGQSPNQSSLFLTLGRTYPAMFVLELEFHIFCIAPGHSQSFTEHCIFSNATDASAMRLTVMVATLT